MANDHRAGTQTTLKAEEHLNSQPLNLQDSIQAGSMSAVTKSNPFGVRRVFPIRIQGPTNTGEAGEAALNSEVHVFKPIRSGC